ncbi:CDP-archaeol synthase [Streptococcus macedonicus]|uniref:Phosphatidate cytidylyltransferase n=2 Tax=Streptococcus TaxID=1301 RepID=A0A081JJN5_STRMC|nr:phosphatidate cytidylyltransferase [Streptococcus macedonicus]SUN59253.1 phosphatidate cytidylyltransferase [Streptococcus gallolyticus]KEH53048.1 phosphatidate cytidylyltransferase [Streptococcus macedonicus]MCW8644723.1 phosphatidate cytidylyltransferase [Streptococcus macedonicus]PHV58039.1 CDP-archaeol synthase [Streptococcus macedonicus]PHV58186.1 CDP-archaeol synthase [Streptococcus macedonicus]
MKQRVIWGAIALLILLPFLLLGGLSFQVFAGLLAMIGVAEMLHMKRLEFFSIEGVLAMLGAFVLTVPLDNYFTSLPLDSSFSVYGLLVFLLLAGTVLNSDDYSFDDVSYPIAASLYVGIGFQNLVNARISGLDKVLFALFIVWATDTGAYMIGRRFGRRKLLPKVSPNKTIEGSLGGIVCAIIVALIFMLVDKAVYTPHNLFAMLIYVVLFSVFGQFGDLVESAIKRHFGVKDSGKLIPGHGGILDRFDSMIFVFPIMHLLGLF